MFPSCSLCIYLAAHSKYNRHQSRLSPSKVYWLQWPTFSTGMFMNVERFPIPCWINHFESLPSLLLLQCIKSPQCTQQGKSICSMTVHAEKVLTFTLHSAVLPQSTHHFIHTCCLIHTCCHNTL